MEMNATEFEAKMDPAENDRLQFGDMLGKLKALLVDFGLPGMWYKNMLDHWDEITEYDPDDLEKGIRQANVVFGETVLGIHELLQENAKYLFGEEFPQESFHGTHCGCHENEEGEQ